MEVEVQDSYGLLSNEVIIAMSRRELNDLRLLLSLARFCLHPATTAIGDDLLEATDQVT